MDMKISQDAKVWRSQPLLEIISAILSLESPTTLLICTLRNSFVATVLDALPTLDHHPLLFPTLESLEKSSKVKVHFCDTLPALYARIAILKGSCQHLVLMYPLTLHSESAHSAQGLAKTMASVVDASVRLEARLIIVEPTTRVKRIEMNFNLDESEESLELLRDPWEQHLPILNATATRFGSERGWVGRTVTARQVVNRWCIWE